MDCFWCEIVQSRLQLKEYEAVKWLTSDTLYSVEWLSADLGVGGKIDKML